jgi:GT2 family glycosyltransferase
MFLDNDQFVAKGWLEQYLSILNNGYDVVGIEAWQLTNALLPLKKIGKTDTYFSYVGCGGMLVKKEVIDKVGLFDERFNPAYFEDPDFNFRIYDAKFKIGFDSAAKIVHMSHQTLGKLNPVVKRQQFIKSYMEFKKKWGNRKPLSIRVTR